MTVSEIVVRPTEAVQRLFQQAGCPTASDTDWGVLEFFAGAIAAVGDSEVPCLNEQTAQRLPHHSLVRFHGMVQDLLNPEYYVGVYSRSDGKRVTTKFSDPDMSELDNYDSHGQPLVWERRPIVCVPIPGLSKWALPNVNRAADTALQHPDPTAAVTMAAGDQSTGQSPLQAGSAGRAAKRERSADAGTQLDADAESSGGVGSAPQGAAVQLELEDSMHDTDLAADQGPGPAAVAGSGAEAVDGGVTRPRIRRREDRAPTAADAPSVQAGDSDSGAVTAQVEGATSGGTERPPVSSEVPGSCMVYLYDNAPALVLHEVVEIIGIVSHVPQLAALEYDNQDPLLDHDLASLELSAEAAWGNDGGGRELGLVNRATGGERLVLEAMRAAHPPTSKVMRLHAILVRRSPQLVPVPPPMAENGISTAMAVAPESAAAAPAATGAAAVEAAPAQPTALTRFVTSATPPAAAAAAAAAARHRDCALGLLRWALGGDVLAAEYVLMQLLGRVAARGDPAALGQLTLNLCRCPRGGRSATPAAVSATAHSRPPLASERLGDGPGSLCTALHAAISSFVPLSVALPLTVESCNRLSWGPQRDPARERTRPSPLQLAPGTVVLLDETLMAPGQLTTQGVASMQALMTISRQQELMYDYETFQHPVPVDLPVIVLTEGRSLLRDSVHVRVPLNATQAFPTAEEVLAATNGGYATISSGATGLSDTQATANRAEGGSPATSAANPTAVTVPPTCARIPEAELAAVRSYLSAARATEGYELADGMVAVLEQYFVDARRPESRGSNGAAAATAASAGGGLTAEEFHTKLTLARLLVLSHGERRLTRERWQQLLRLEHMREARLRVGS